MGHYLLLTGWDESLNQMNTMDSFKGPNTRYSYDDIEHYWQHFNYTYIALYTADREEELLALLGADADEWQNHIKALEMARAEAIADQEDAHAWFNMGTNFVKPGHVRRRRRKAYDKAISLGLPWRMFWYQFGAWEAYYHTGRYDDMIPHRAAEPERRRRPIRRGDLLLPGHGARGPRRAGQGAAELHRRADVQPQLQPGAGGARSAAGGEWLI